VNRGARLARHLFTVSALVAGATTVACGGDAAEGRKMSSPPLREDLPLDEAEASAPEPSAAQSLASAEAQLAQYEARLAQAGVEIERGLRRGDGSGPVDAPGDFEQSEQARADSSPDPGLEPDSAATGSPSKTTSSSNKSATSAKRPSSRPQRRRNEKNEDADRDFAPAPPAGGSAGSKKDKAAVGGAASSDDRSPTPREALADEVEAEEEASRIDPKPRCEELCSLADAICALEDRVCKLADEHAWDQRYADACTRASEDCDAAREACTTCEP